MLDALRVRGDHLSGKPGNIFCEVLRFQLVNECSAHAAVIATNQPAAHPARNYSLFSGTAWVTGHKKGKPFWILLEQDTMGWWQWRQLYHMQIICTSLQTGNHTSTPRLSFYRPDADSVFTGRMPFLSPSMPNQQHQSTEGIVHH